MITFKIQEKIEAIVVLHKAEVRIEIVIMIEEVVNTEIEKEIKDEINKIKLKRVKFEFSK